jgi:uncharacterized protein YndB with AHSA1/START domain
MADHRAAKAPGHDLAVEWRGRGDLVTIELVPDSDGTELTLVHERFTDDASRGGHAQGWSDCLDRLPGWLAGPG